MEIKAIYKHARISAFKARDVGREIQGLSVSEALDLLSFTPKKAAVLFRKTLKSAIANAENNNDLRADDLVVKEAVVGEGPTLKRFRPKARGSAGSICKRTSHFRIVLSDQMTPSRRLSRDPNSKQKSRPRQRAEGNAAPAPATDETSAQSE